MVVLQKVQKTVFLALSLAIVSLLACGGETITVVETVVVEKEVSVKGDTVIETVEVEVVVKGDTVIETVEVSVKGDTVIETVIVEKRVEVEKKVDVETIVTATAESYGSGAGSRAYSNPRDLVAPKIQSGIIVVEVPRIPGTYVTSRPYDGFTSDNNGIADPLIYADPAPIPIRGAFNPGISLVNGWKVADDASSIIFDLRKGVMFHHGWGEMTAEDVAWSFNDALAEGNTNGRSGFVGEWMGEWEVVDSHTVKMNVIEGAALSPVWLLELSNTWRNTLTVTSKKFNLEHPEEAKLLKIGTGPFQMEDHAIDDFVDVVAVPGPHYRSVPNIAGIKFIAMGDAQVKVAAFKTGEVDIVNIPAQFIKGAVEAVSGAYIQKLGEGQTLHLYNGGNFWQQTHPVTGDQLYPREGLLVDDAHPWIGDPYAPGCDQDNLFGSVPPAKPACENMENARKFRWALAMAIDRDAINEIIGLGQTPPAYTFTGFSEDNPEWNDDWFIPYDPAAAKKSLSELGISEGFKMKTWVVPDSSALPPDIAEAAVQFWVDELGFDVEVESTNYSARRPTLIGRTISIPFHHHMNVGYADEPKGRLVSASKGGANRGIELPNPVLDKTYLANLAQGDAVARIANNIWMEDYMSYWMLNIPLVYQNSMVAVSGRIKEWTPYTETFGNQNSFDTIVLAN